MTKFTKSFLWRFILDIILLGIFVRFCQNIILTITSRFISTYSTPFLLIEAVVVSAISMLFICFITYWNIGNQYVVYLLYYLLEYRCYFKQMESYEALRGL